jgi:hypothetical protein
MPSNTFPQKLLYGNGSFSSPQRVKVVLGHVCSTHFIKNIKDIRLVSKKVKQ